jgi:hypothetical protein
MSHYAVSLKRGESYAIVAAMGTRNRKERRAATGCRYAAAEYHAQRHIARTVKYVRTIA